MYIIKKTITRKNETFVVYYSGSTFFKTVTSVHENEARVFVDLIEAETIARLRMGENAVIETKIY